MNGNRRLSRRSPSGRTLASAAALAVFLIASLLAVALVAPAPASADAGVDVYVDGQRIDSISFNLDEGKVYVDAAAYVERLGGTYEERHEAGSVVVDGRELPAKRIHGDLYVHIRDLSAARATETVEWDALGSTVYVVTKPTETGGTAVSKVATFVGLFATCTLAAFAALKRLGKRKRSMTDRIRDHLPDTVRIAGSAAASPASKASKPRKGRLTLARTLASAGRLFRSAPFALKRATLLRRAGLTLRAEEFFALRLGVGLLSSALGAASFGSPALSAAICFAVGYKAPLLVVRHKGKRRVERFAEQLPVAIGMMSTSLRAGFSLMQAMQMVAKESDGPIGEEFALVHHEIQFGVPFDDAFQRLAERIPDPNVGILSTALAVQRGTGGNLTEILDTIQETIVERIRMKEDVNTLTSQGKLSSWIITLLPVALMLLLQMMNPSYFDPMLSHPIGWFMLGMAATMTLTGWLLIRKIVTIEV